MAIVLIVDDDKFTRSVLQTALTRDPAFAGLDIKIHTAVNGKEALLAFREFAPDAVIVDLLMPEMDGFTLCKHIRDLPEGDYVHLLCMSGIYRDRKVVERVKSEFRAEFFAKPYQLRDLTQHLATLLDMDARGEDSRSISIPVPDEAQARSGDLSERALPAVLLDLLEQQCTGQLHLQRGGIRKTVDLLVGHPRSVASTARDETLGHFLVAFGVLAEDQVKEAIRHAGTTKQKLADVIVARGLLSPEKMIQRLTMLTSYRLMQSLRWPDGVWRFEPHSASSRSGGGNPIDMVSVVLQGLKYTATPDTVPERVVAIEHSGLELTARGQALMPAVRQHLSERFCDIWQAGDTIADLVAKGQGQGQGMDRGELFTTLDALLACEALEQREDIFSEVEVELDNDDDDDDSSMTSQSPMSQTSDLSVAELSEAVNRRSERAGQDLSGELYDTLFDDVSVAPMSSSGDIPIELPDDAPDVIDSNRINLEEMKHRIDQSGATQEETNFARRVLLKEYLRIQGRDHYELLKVAPKATAQEIAAAFESRKSKLAMDWFARFDLGRDYAKLEEIHVAYEQAARTLLEVESRAAYDKSLGTDAAPEPEELALDAEIAYHAGQDLLDNGSYKAAIEQLQIAIAAAPNEAEYHAVLGWARYLEGGRTPRAADESRPHLNHGLRINPDHALSHEYKGIISAALGTDEAEAIFHLQRALESDPNRTQALETLEKLWHKRGELRPLERQYRRLIYRTSGANPETELVLWRKLAHLYLDWLHEPANARVAFESAARLAPNDPEIRAALNDLGGGSGDHFSQVAEHLQNEWSASPMTPEPGLQLMRLARDSEHPDPAFLAASALVARHCTESEAIELYQRYRPRFVMRAQRQMDQEAWKLLRHPQDLAELNELFELLDPVIETSFPFDVAELEVDVAAMEVPEAELPEPFRRVRAYVAQMLDVDVPSVIARPEYGHQIHVAALVPPVLLAGDEVITSPERLELAFRLGRAMTYLLPGRTFAGSRPTRLLKAAVLAVFSTMHQGLQLDDPNGYIARIQSFLDILPPNGLADSQALVMEITRKSPSLNLSLWSQALARTATRFGFILCGDLPQSVRFARDGSTPAVMDDLIDFAVSRQCWALRSHLGLSIDV